VQIIKTLKNLTLLSFSLVFLGNVAFPAEKNQDTVKLTIESAYVKVGYTPAKGSPIIKNGRCTNCESLTYTDGGRKFVKNVECVGFVKRLRPDLNSSWGGTAKAALSTFASSHEVNVLPRVGSAFIMTGKAFSKTGHTGVVTNVVVVPSGDPAFFQYKLSITDSNFGWPSNPGKVRAGVELEVRFDAQGGVKQLVNGKWSNSTFSSLSFVHEKKADYDSLVRKPAIDLIKALQADGILLKERNGKVFEAEAYLPYFERVLAVRSPEIARQIAQVASKFSSGFSRGLEPGNFWLNSALQNNSDAEFQALLKKLDAEIVEKAKPIGPNDPIKKEVTAKTDLKKVGNDPALHEAIVDQTNANLIQDTKTDETALEQIAPKPAASGRFFGWAAYFAQNTQKTVVTGPGNGSVRTHNNGHDSDAELIKLTNRAPAQNGFHIQAGLPDEDEDVTTFTNVRAIEEVNAQIDRYKPGVFVNSPLIANLGGLANYDLQNYSYAAWGKWNGEIKNTDTDTINQYHTEIYETVGKKGYWVAGEVSTSQAIKDRVGKATYKGSMIGDYLAAGSSVVEQGAAIGNLTLDMSFNTNTLNGRADIFLYRNGALSYWLKPDPGKLTNIVGGIVAPDNVFDPRWQDFEGDDDPQDLTQLPADFQQGLRDLGPVFAAKFDNVDLRGNNLQQGVGYSSIIGSFFGSTGAEIGGQFDIEKATGSDPGIVTGVFRALEKPQ
jgi:hypothetical protein